VNEDSKDLRAARAAGKSQLWKSETKEKDEDRDFVIFVPFSFKFFQAKENLALPCASPITYRNY